MKLFDLVKQALDEDLPGGDLTTDNLNLGERLGRARLVAKEDLVISGQEAFQMSFLHLDPEVKLHWPFKDGDFVLKSQTVAVLTGHLEALLKGERVALNFIGHLSGIASLTRCFVEQVKHTSCQILDTRKTTPLWRSLEKQAVRHGRGHNHRLNLSEAVLVKDNHIAACGDLKTAVQKIRQSFAGPIEVECAELSQVEEAVALNVDRILLDNMDNSTLEQALALIPKRIQTEASGNMSLDRVRSVAELGVDFISVGALTHSAPCADLSLEFEFAEGGKPQPGGSL